MIRLHPLVIGFVVIGCGVQTDPPPAPTSPSSSSSSSSSGSEAPLPATTTSSPPTSAPTASPATTAPPVPQGPATLHDNRDRLIDTLATQKGKTRCPLWTSLTPTQRGVFLTITDLLGKRSFLTNDPANNVPRTGPDLMMALDHVTKVYEIRDSNGDDGGEQNNRIFLQFDTTLITAMRDFSGSLPEWGTSNDLGGAHAPFDATSETSTGQPRGQSQFWSADAKSVALTRPGVEGINDPHIVEIDIDYDWIHHSNPAGDYWPNGKGIDYYSKVWTPIGLGTSPEFDYVPTTCN